MSDYIKREDAIFIALQQPLYSVVSQIKQLDGIDIVRCKECKHWRAYETWSECELWTDDPYESAKTKADDFCSYGERKSDEY